MTNEFLKIKKIKMKRINIKHKLGILILTALISTTGFFGCGTTSTTAPQADNISFSSLSSKDSLGDAQNYFVLDTVKILIKDIKLDIESSTEENEFKVGPFVVFLDLSSGINYISTALIPSGTYEKVKFEIHKLNDNEVVPDPEFADANGRYSVIIKGWYFGNYFVYKSTKPANQILRFPNSCVVPPSILTNITLSVKPYIWFVKNGAYLDPREPANSNDIDNNIKDNIKNNFKAFKDDDRNGSPD